MFAALFNNELTTHKVDNFRCAIHGRIKQGGQFIFGKKVSQTISAGILVVIDCTDCCS